MVTWEPRSRLSVYAYTPISSGLGYSITTEGQKTQNLSHFQLRHPAVVRPSGLETKLDAAARLQTFPIKTIYKFKHLLSEVVFTNFTVHRCTKYKSHQTRHSDRGRRAVFTPPKKVLKSDVLFGC